MEHKNKLKKLLLLPLFLGLAALIAAAAVTAAEKWQESRVDTDALFFSALEEMNSWSSYRYNLKANIHLHNGKTAETALNGECDSSGNLHVYGKMMDTEMEAYQFGNDHYRLNRQTKQWIHLTESPLLDNGVLKMMLEPVKNFAFSDTISVDYEGLEKEGKTKYYRYTAVPKEGFHVADTYFTDFTYKIDIDAKTKRIAGGIIHSVSRTESKNALTLTISFYDVNEAFTLTPPENSN